MNRRICCLVLLVLQTLVGLSQERVDSAVVDLLRKDYGITFVQHNHITIFHTGQEKFDDLFHAVRRAKRSIHLEYFNFRNDSISDLLFQLLTQKASEGVQVRALFDGFGNMSNNRPLKSHHVASLRRGGIDIVEFDPVKFPWVNHAVSRDHRKIVIIDDSIAYTGGMNVADYYIVGKEEFGDWRDIHCRLEGPVVSQLQDIFIQFWNEVTGQHLPESADQDVLSPRWQDVATEPCDTLCDTLFTPLPYASVDAQIGVVNRVPHKSPKALRNTFVALINHANTQIQIINPYFIPGRKVMRALKRALRRGVDVQIIVSDKSDIPITPRVVEHCVHRLMKRGASVYMYTGGFHHSKIMMVDSCISYIGSANLNSRSLRYDYECNLLIPDAPATHVLQQIFERDKQTRCYQLTPEAWQTFSRSRRFAAWFYQILTPFL